MRTINRTKWAFGGRDGRNVNDISDRIADLMEHGRNGYDKSYKTPKRNEEMLYDKSYKARQSDGSIGEIRCRLENGQYGYRNPALTKQTEAR